LVRLTDGGLGIYGPKHVASVRMSHMVLNSFVKGNRSLYTYVYSITHYRTPSTQEKKRRTLCDRAEIET